MINSDNQKFSEIRFDWEREEILEILNYPLIDLMWEAQIIHRRFNQYKVQLASLFSVKTGGCEENCSYCSQSIYSCLLYTSPSPRDATLSRMPSSA